MVMSSQSNPRRRSSDRRLAASEPLFLNPLEPHSALQPETRRSGSAPARPLFLGDTDSYRAFEIEFEALREQSRQPIVIEGASSVQKSDVAAVGSSARESKKRSASEPPKPAHGSEIMEPPHSDDDSAHKTAQGSAFAIKDFAEIPREKELPHDAAEPEHPAPREEQTAPTPSKRAKSDIAPWMTPRHKAAIRRSLGASTASETSVERPPSQTGADPKGKGKGKARDP